MSRPSDIPRPVRLSRLQLASRMAAAVFGGYVFAWGFISAATSALFAAGMGFHDAEFLSTALGLLAFVTAFLWAFVARRVALTWLVLVGGGALLAATASAVQAALL